ncbi:MAG: RIP metalloprotease RseP [Candidatus Uhrbacteria bacterium]|nr:RIP metalloprotease RseP [Candidatus Uhrbacteria bacterium]
MIWTIIIFLVVLSVLVLAHEWGHYFTARKIGAKVEEFGLGFPPRLYSWKGKDGMEWSINLIPIGGFVKIKGESGDGRNDKDSFASKSVYKRTIVLLAGVFMNLVIATVIFTIGFVVGIPAITEGGVSKYAIVTEESVNVTDVLSQSPADIAGMQVGDEIVSINGVAYASGEEAREVLVAGSEGDVFEFSILREGEAETILVQSSYIEEIERSAVGVVMLQTGTVRYPFYLAPVKGVELTVRYTGAITYAFYDIIKGLVVGDGMSVEVSGPIGIAQYTGEAVRMGFLTLLNFAAILSINLAIINVLPFPALDGGRAVFVLIEAIRRKPASPKLEAVIHNLGFALLMILIIVVTYRDVLNLL